MISGIVSRLNKVTSSKPNIFDKFGDWIKQRWNDFTGVSAVREQNKAQLDLAKYQAQVNEDFYNKYSSPQAMMRQYEEAGLNRNLVYGSAGAGQGNVPRFDAPHVERNLSGSDKINKALSMFNTLMGIKQSVFQVEAAREVAEQQSIKTLSDLVNYRRNARDYDFENTTSGYQEQTLWKRMFNKRRGAITQADVEALIPDGINPNYKLDSYLAAKRQYDFDRFVSQGILNRSNTADAVNKEIQNRYLPTKLDYGNRMAKLDFEVADQFRNATEVTNIVTPWLKSLIQIIAGFARSSIR